MHYAWFSRRWSPVLFSTTRLIHSLYVHSPGMDHLQCESQVCTGSIPEVDFVSCAIDTILSGVWQVHTTIITMSIDE